jgi:hypothetical protein
MLHSFYFYLINVRTCFPFVGEDIPGTSKDSGVDNVADPNTALSNVTKG